MNMNKLRETVSTDHDLESEWSWIVMAAVVAVFLIITTRLVGQRIENGSTIWYTDYAIFRQAGYLLGHGAPGEVYRYVPSTPEARASLGPIWSDYAQHHVNPSGNWEGYYYAQAPWQALFMVPLAYLSIEQGFMLFSYIMIFSMVTAAVVLAKYTDHGWAWGSSLLIAPIVLPIISGHPWRESHYSITSIATAELRFGSPLTSTLWYGQYTPFLLCLLVVGLVAVARRRMALAAFMICTAMMKPTVVFVLPAFLLVIYTFDDLIDLARWGIIWTIMFSIVFTLIPNLGYPFKFVRLTTSYSDVTLPILLQSHNWILYLGVPIAALALYYHGPRDDTHDPMDRTEANQ